jgi:HPt (histidine-containing phosphotransfer) domain-containing protein
MKNFNLVLTFLFLTFTLLPAQEVRFVPPIPPEPYFEINEKTEQEYLNNVGAELKLKLQAIKEYDKAEYYNLLNELQYSKMEHHFFSSREKDFNELEQQIVAFEIESKSLLAKMKKSEATQKPKLKLELKDSISKLFDLKEKRRSIEIERLEERLNELNKKLKIRNKNKAEIINRRMLDLLGEDDYLEWD